MLGNTLNLTWLLKELGFELTHLFRILIADSIHGTVETRAPRNTLEGLPCFLSL
jgi:hypothetical protein